MRGLLGLIVVVLLVLHNLPYLIRDQAVLWLRSQGVEQVSIKALKVDWLQGEIDLVGVSARSQDQLPLQLEQLHVALDYSALMQKRIHIRLLSVAGLTSGVAQRKQLWLGPLNLSQLSSGETEAPETADAAPSAWLLGIDQLRLDRIDWQVRLPKQKHRLKVRQAALDKLYLWDIQQVTALQLEGTLNGAPLRVSTTMTPLPDRKHSTLSLQVKQFPLQSVTALVEPGLRAAVDLDLTFEVAVEGEHSRVQQRGEIRVADLSWQREGLSIRQSALGWDGSVALQMNRGQPESLALDGHLQGKGSHFEQPDRQVALASFASDVQVQSADMQSFSVNLPEVRMAEGQLRSAEQPLLSMAQLSLKNAALQWPLAAEVADVTLDGLTVAGSDGDWIRLAQLRLAQLAYDGAARLSLQAINLHGAAVTAVLSSEGELRDLVWLQQQLAPPDPAQVQEADEEAVATVQREGASQTPFSVYLGGVTVTGSNPIQFRDEGVTPAFSAQLDIERLTLGALDTAVVQVTPFELATRINRFANLNADGELELTGTQHNGRWALALKGLELPPLSPYAERYTGYYLNSGQFNLQSEGALSAGTLTGSNKLRIHRLSVDQRDAGRVDAFTQRLTMPLETAIMVLEDNDNNIKLDLPVSGTLSDPQFGYQSIINDLATRGLKRAALSFLTKSLQPYATLISLAKTAVEASEKGAFITLAPVQFAPGSIELDASARDYLNKLAEMLTTRQAMRLNICGRAVAADRALLEPGLVDANRKRKQPLAPEALAQELQQHLEQLASQRAEQVKALLIERVDASRVFLCFAQVETASDAQPRAELGL